MSTQMVSEQVCYIYCNFCNTILAVNVPGNSLFNIVTVRCGHCANLLSVNMGALLQTLPLHDQQLQNQYNFALQSNRQDLGSSSKYSWNDQQQILALRPPEKRQRVPSAYNRFIREEIQRIKANNPDISHKEAFSAAAKNFILKVNRDACPNMHEQVEFQWAHLPDIHFGLSLDGNSHSQVNLEEAIAAPAAEKAPAFY